MSPDTGLNPVISQLRDHLAFAAWQEGAQDFTLCRSQ
jgi:hypothetical protein